MPDDINASKKSEYFIALGKKSIHSFLMLGVIDEEGSPRLLARVGKVNDIDPNSSLIGNLGTGSLSVLGDEGVTRRYNFSEQIPYQAYAINYEQVKEFLALIALIEKEQLANKVIADALSKKPAYMQTISCYLPTETEEDMVTFQHKKLKDCQFVTSVKNAGELAKGTQRLHVNNTCRHTALNVLKTILGFETDISERFYISPKYETTLTGGQPDIMSFYILPPPPNVVKERLSLSQFELLGKLYKRMEAIPLKNPDSKATRAKFDAIKLAYDDIVGDNHLSAGELLGKLVKYEKAHKGVLFEKRSPNALSRFFAINSTTENLFKEIKKALQKEQTAHDSTAKTGAPPP